MSGPNESGVFGMYEISMSCKEVYTNKTVMKPIDDGSRPARDVTLGTSALDQYSGTSGIASSADNGSRGDISVTRGSTSTPSNNTGPHVTRN